MIENLHNQNQDRGMVPKVPRGQELRIYLATVLHNVEQLERAVQSLPRVNTKGSSECPFAEDLYAQKEELESAVGRDVAMLGGYLAALQEDVARCENNLQRIRTDAGNLTVPEALDAYGTAENTQNDEYYQAVTDRDSIVLVLPRAESALLVSRHRKYPGDRPPRRQTPASLPQSHGGAAGPLPSDAPPASRLDPELDSVLAIGPLTQG